MEEDSVRPLNNVAVLKLCISDLEQEIGVIFSQIQHLKQKCIHKKFMLENTGQKIKLPTAKLRSYRSRIQNVFLKTKEHQELENMKDNIAQKKQALRDLQIKLEINATSHTNKGNCSFRTTETEIQSEICFKIQQLQEIKINLHTSITELEVQISSLKEEELQMEQNIKIIHKRNAAQLLRIKRLINEARLREQHWSAKVQKCLHKMPHPDNK